MYVADFYCHQLKLIIEIDGSVHQLEEVKRNDKVRQQHLENLGIKVIRFTNNDVMHNLENVLSQIKQTLQLEAMSK